MYRHARGLVHSNQILVQIQDLQWTWPGKDLLRLLFRLIQTDSQHITAMKNRAYIRPFLIHTDPVSAELHSPDLPGGEASPLQILEDGIPFMLFIYEKIDHAHIFIHRITAGELLRRLLHVKFQKGRFKFNKFLSRNQVKSFIPPACVPVVPSPGESPLPAHP